MGKMEKVIFFCLIILLAVVSSCKKDNPIPPEDQPQINLTLEDVSCTEAWIKLNTSNLPLPADVDLYKDSVLAKSINLTSSDTILYIDSLLPNESYSFRPIIQSTNQSINSASILVTTLDSISHDYNFHVYLFGEHQQSVIRDIAIIDQNDIWAVGEIYLLDSLGQNDPTRYNLIVRDGNNWEIKRVPYYYQGQPYYNPIESIFAFGSDDIWFCGNGVVHWNGAEYVPIPISSNIWGQYLMNKIWGTSGQDIYVVGDNGNIAHYNGQSWGRMESGTTVDLLDIWGSSDGTLWGCGHTGDYNTTVLLRNTGSGWEKLYEGNSENQNNGYQIGPINGIWGTNEFRIYMINKTGLYIQPNRSELELDKEIVKTGHFCFSADGTDDNNIFISGEWFVGHWNGVSYREYPELYKQFRKYYSIKVKDNTVCAGGTDYNGPIYSQAVIVLSE